MNFRRQKEGWCSRSARKLRPRTHGSRWMAVCKNMMSIDHITPARTVSSSNDKNHQKPNLTDRYLNALQRISWSETVRRSISISELFYYKVNNFKIICWQHTRPRNMAAWRCGRGTLIKIKRIMSAWWRNVENRNTLKPRDQAL